MSSHKGVDPLLNLAAVVEGTRAAYVWTSPQFSGAVMTRVFAEVGVEVGAQDHGLPKRFARAVNLEYAGPMSPEAAQSAIEEIQNARHTSDISL